METITTQLSLLFLAGQNPCPMQTNPFCPWFGHDGWSEGVSPAREYLSHPGALRVVHEQVPFDWISKHSIINIDNIAKEID